MSRAVCLVALALVICPATGLQLQPEAEGCSECCPGEAPDSSCPPDCIMCLRCPQTAPALPAPSIAPSALVRVGAAASEADPAACPPPPHEIFHVPRFLS